MSVFKAADALTVSSFLAHTLFDRERCQHVKQFGAVWHYSAAWASAFTPAPRFPSSGARYRPV